MSMQSAGHTWCKICGVTSVVDAQASEQAGADALGFNCYEQSPRYVSLERIAKLTASVAITRVALFVNADARQVESVLAAGAIDLLQFHGDESESFCASFGQPYIKALRMKPGVDVQVYADTFSSAWALLLDAYVPGQPGGTGEQFNWMDWPSISATRLILAGGLTASNVGSAITQLAPYGVDVSGGVEGRYKGQKDLRKVMNFLQEVRRVGGE